MVLTKDGMKFERKPSLERLFILFVIVRIDAGAACKEGICSLVSLFKNWKWSPDAPSVLLDALLSRLGRVPALCFYQSDYQRSFNEITRQASLREAGKIQQGLSLLEGLRKLCISCIGAAVSLIYTGSRTTQANKDPWRFIRQVTWGFELQSFILTYLIFDMNFLSPIEAEIIGLMSGIQQKEARIEAIRSGRRTCKKPFRSKIKQQWLYDCPHQPLKHILLPDSRLLEEAAQHVYLARDLSIESHDRYFLLRFYSIGRSESRE